MTNPHTYTTDAMATTSACDPDIVNENLEYLKYAADNGGGGVVDFNNLGTVTTDITLAENVITTGYWSGTNTITLPTVTDTTKQVTCILDFTTASSGQPTITNTNLKWSDLNQGKAPSSYSVISGVRNVLVFKSIWISASLYWEVEYRTYGGVETSFVQPPLTSNGTLGGTSFAVAASSALNGARMAYGAFDKGSGSWHSAAGAPWWIEFYSPIPLKVQSLSISGSGEAPGINAFTLYGSNDNSNFTAIQSYTITGAQSGTDIVTVSSANQGFYTYYKMQITGANYNAGGVYYAAIGEITIGAVYIAT